MTKNSAQEGTIKFFLGSVDIIVKQRDVVGNIMQEWLEGWLKKNGVEYAVSENTQMPPDFFLDKENRTKALLEIKAFEKKSEQLCTLKEQMAKYINETGDF